MLSNQIKLTVLAKLKSHSVNISRLAENDGKREKKEMFAFVDCVTRIRLIHKPLNVTRRNANESSS